ncbi:hypothetical protein ABD91_21110 [Lysinibacillus sphaericus]|uniref:hypothetical protein n=1 Tax=Lysinibacillus sphaericus TaxID=1421 RepID=UPI0018CEE53B|nr:hypothetical protein [Lysinibacillus sphaericus]MBG9693241.1 hypothetical protein [Lysinibacillus sphaericus]
MRTAYNILFILSTMYNITLIFTFEKISQSELFTSKHLYDLLQDAMVILSTNIVLLVAWRVFDHNYENHKESITENKIYAGICFTVNCLLIGCVFWYQLGI